MVPESIFHTSPTNNHNTDDQTNYSCRIERRMEDSLEKKIVETQVRTIKSSMYREATIGKCVFFVTRTRTCRSSSSIGRLAFKASQLPVALCNFGVESNRTCFVGTALTAAIELRINIFVCYYNTDTLLVLYK